MAAYISVLLNVGFRFVSAFQFKNLKQGPKIMGFLLDKYLIGKEITVSEEILK